MKLLSSGELPGSASVFPLAAIMQRNGLETDSMDKENWKGKAKKAEGHAKETAGKITGDKSLEVKGKADRVEGEVRDAIGDAKDAARDRKKD
jgi:uncharacterized protein YjbJ (UPF0337 family)